MNTAAVSPSNPLESHRPLTPRSRMVRVRGRRVDDVDCVRDPISLQYFYFNQFERMIARLLNGEYSLAQVLELAGDSQAPASAPVGGTPRVTPRWLLQFVARLEKACLTGSRDAVRSGRLLWARGQATQRDRRLRRWTSPLAIRIRGFDPTNLLKVLEPLASSCF